MRVLGIDPAVNKTGWAIVDKDHARQLRAIASGVIKPQSTLSLADKLVIISQEMEQLITTYQPKHVAIEKMFVNRNFASSINFSQARGAILAAVASFGLQIAEYFPNTVKRVVTGQGHASKEQIGYMIGHLIPNTAVRTADEADALAVAYTFFVHNQTNY